MSFPNRRGHTSGIKLIVVCSTCPRISNGWIKISDTYRRARIWTSRRTVESSGWDYCITRWELVIVHQALPKVFIRATFYDEREREIVAYLCRTAYSKDWETMKRNNSILARYHLKGEDQREKKYYQKALWHNHTGPVSGWRLDIYTTLGKVQMEKLFYFIAVSISMVDGVLMQLYNCPGCGHLDVTQTIEKIKQSFY